MPQKNTKSSMRAIFLLMVFAGALLVFPGKVQAVFDLSVTQIDGGFDLRFGRVEPSDFKLVKQLTLRVNSDTGKAYRVFQQLLQPLATPQGEPLDPEQFKMYALQGSNSRGTLIYRQEEPVVQAQTLVYTSNTTGENDSFQLVYTITPKENQAPGSYYGRMAFILIPVDAAMSQVVVNVQISVELTTGSATVADIVTNTGSDRIVIDTEDMHVTREGVEGSWPQVNIKVAGPLGAPYRVYQSLEGGDVTTSDGYNFDLDKVAVLYEGGRQGMISAASTLKGARQRQLIYASDPRGSSDEITITYKPTQDFRLAKDGLYRGRLVLYIDVDQMTGPAQPKLKTLDVEFHVSPVFDIRVYSQDQEGVALEFGNISYKSGPKSSENEIFVESNLGKPYTIVQMVSSPMVSESGEKVSGDSFVMKVKDVVSDETPKAYVQEFVPVREGENKIFSSGPAGASARLKVEYRLTMGAESKAGNYKTRIGYSLVLD